MTDWRHGISHVDPRECRHGRGAIIDALAILSVLMPPTGFFFFFVCKKIGKVGVELFLDAQAILEDSGGAVRMCGGFDVTLALVRDDGSKLGLARGFNSIFGTEVRTGGPSLMPK